jgi:hypothetical protein
MWVGILSEGSLQTESSTLENLSQIAVQLRSAIKFEPRPLLVRLLVEFAFNRGSIAVI